MPGALVRFVLNELHFRGILEKSYAFSIDAGLISPTVSPLIGNTLPEDTRRYQMILKLKMVLKLLLKLLLLLLTAKLAKLLLRLP
jgi:hypothetical protein